MKNICIFIDSDVFSHLSNMCQNTSFLALLYANQTLCFLCQVFVFIHTYGWSFFACSHEDTLIRWKIDPSIYKRKSARECIESTGICSFVISDFERLVNFIMVCLHSTKPLLLDQNASTHTYNVGICQSCLFSCRTAAALHCSCWTHRALLFTMDQICLRPTNFAFFPVFLSCNV